MFHSRSQGGWRVMTRREIKEYNWVAEAEVMLSDISGRSTSHHQKPPFHTAGTLRSAGQQIFRSTFIGLIILFSFSFSFSSSRRLLAVSYTSCIIGVLWFDFKPFLFRHISMRPKNVLQHSKLARAPTFDLHSGRSCCGGSSQQMWLLRNCWDVFLSFSHLTACGAQTEPLHSAIRDFKKWVHTVCARAGRGNFTVDEADTWQSQDIDTGEQTGRAGFLLGENARVQPRPLHLTLLLWAGGGRKASKLLGARSTNRKGSGELHLHNKGFEISKLSVAFSVKWISLFRVEDVETLITAWDWFSLIFVFVFLK